MMKKKPTIFEAQTQYDQNLFAQVDQLKLFTKPKTLEKGILINTLALSNSI